MVSPDSQDKKIQDLGLDTERIPKLLFRYSLPAIISMTAASLYNIVDVIFIGRGVSAMAIAGLSITLPLMNMSSAFGSLIGVGASSLVAVRLGQRDIKSAEVALGNAVTLNLIIGICYSIVALLFLEPLLLFFGASSESLPYAKEYMQIILFGNVFTHLYLGLNDNLRASGYPKIAMIATLTAVGINCILDPIFIFGFKWGIRGAAIATVTSQLAALVWLLIHYMNPKSLLHFKKGIFKIRKGVPGSIISVGLSPFLLNVCNCFIVILINRAFYKYGGDFAVGAYGIANRLIFLVVMVALGFNQGMQPLVGFNYGAQKYDRVIKLFWATLCCVACVCTLAFVLCEFFPEPIVRLFTNHPQLIDLTVQGLRIDVLLFPLIAIPLVVSSFFQAIRKPGKAIFMSLTRQVIFLIPLLLILPRFYGTLGVWASLPASDTISILVGSILIYRQLKSFKQYGK